MWLGSGVALLWLWCRPAATALIQPLAWELPYATGTALKKTKGKKKKGKGRRLEKTEKQCKTLDGWTKKMLKDVHLGNATYQT